MIVCYPFSFYTISVLTNVLMQLHGSSSGATVTPSVYVYMLVTVQTHTACILCSTSKAMN